MTIEELNKIIEEIEQKEKQYEIIKERRRNRHQRRRKKEELRKHILFFILTIPLSTSGALASYNYLNNELNNIYNGNSLKISSSKKEIIRSRIEEELGINLEDINKDNSLLINAIIENDNLTHEEKKDFSLDILKIVDSNPYILSEKAYTSLLNLEIEYENRPEYVKKSIQGEYHFSELFNKVDSKIYIYEQNGTNVKEHELIHCLLMNLENNDFPKFIKEGITELLTVENFSENPYIAVECYPFEIITIKLLCEIIGKEKVLESYSTGNINIIYDKLNEITTDIKPTRLLNEIELILNDFTNGIAPNPYKVNLVHNMFLKYFVLSKEEKDYKAFSSNLNLFDCLMEEYPYTKFIIKVAEEKYEKKLYFAKQQQNKALKKTLI